MSASVYPCCAYALLQTLLHQISNHGGDLCQSEACAKSRFPAATLAATIRMMAGPGEGGPIHATYLRTPAGDFTEQEVAQTIKTMILSSIPETVQLGKMLCRLRDERSKTMGSLLRDGGWSSNREGRSATVWRSSVWQSVSKTATLKCICAFYSGALIGLSIRKSQKTTHSLPPPLADEEELNGASGFE